METTEGNKLIAKFMEVTNEISDLYYLPQFGHYFNSYGNIEFNEVFRSTELKYHSSWDWLMPVVEKCLTISVESEEYEIHYAFIHNALWSINIKSVFDEVVEFIKWYNDQKK